jgi:ketosteroid isomerase-like protein
MNNQLGAQFAKGEAAVISQMYSADATVLPPGSDMVKGRENIEKLWKGAIDGMTDLRITTKEVLPLSGDAVREICTFTAKTKSDDSTLPASLPSCGCVRGAAGRSTPISGT